MLVAEDFADQKETIAGHSGNRREGVTKVVNPKIGQFCLGSDAPPRPLDPHEVASRRLTCANIRLAIASRESRQELEGRGSKRDVLGSRL